MIKIKKSVGPAYWYAKGHFLIGTGLGVILARPLFGEHPIRWGGLLISLGLLVHLWLRKK